MSQLLRSHAGTETTFSRQPKAVAAAVLEIGIGSADKLLCFVKSVLGGKVWYGLSPIRDRTCRTNHRQTK